jgi:hypothetical protein
LRTASSALRKQVLDDISVCPKAFTIPTDGKVFTSSSSVLGGACDAPQSARRRTDVSVSAASGREQICCHWVGTK